MFQSMGGQTPGVKLDLDVVLIPIGFHLFDYSDIFYSAVCPVFLRAAQK
jgi:hypothetical protein